MAFIVYIDAQSDPVKGIDSLRHFVFLCRTVVGQIASRNLHDGASVTCGSISATT
jgi:hypothetical protein